MFPINIVSPVAKVRPNPWDDSADIYAAVASKISFYRETSRQLVALAKVEEGMSIVDLGCGSACLTISDLLFTYPRLETIYGIDRSPQMLRVASRRITSKKVVFLLASAETLQSALHCNVNRVLCNSALWLFDTAAIAEISRSLSANGLFIFSYPEFDLVDDLKYSAINDELASHGQKRLPKRSTSFELQVRLEDLVSKSFYLTDVYHMKIAVSAREWSYFYQIPSVVRRLMPQLPL
jgi:ubiquinone/menaquinone biosynthesis C-methylase UbiE